MTKFLEHRRFFGVWVTARVARFRSQLLLRLIRESFGIINDDVCSIDETDPKKGSLTRPLLVKSSPRFV